MGFWGCGGSQHFQKYTSLATLKKATQLHETTTTTLLKIMVIVLHGMRLIY
jgi:hypothetical protein